jgi:hypothetical protein
MYWKRQTFFLRCCLSEQIPFREGRIAIQYINLNIDLCNTRMQRNVRNKNQTIKSKRFSLKHISLGILLRSLLLSYQNLHKVTTPRKQLGLS